MANQRGIAIVVKAFLPFGKSVEEQLAALNAVVAANKSGDYIALFTAKGIVIDEVKAEEKTRRVELKPETAPAAQAETADASGLKEAFDAVPPAGDVDQVEPAGTVGGAQIEGNDEQVDVPAFLRSAATAG
jgi:hypothetical protein